MRLAATILGLVSLTGGCAAQPAISASGPPAPPAAAVQRAPLPAEPLAIEGCTDDSVKPLVRRHPDDPIPDWYAFQTYAWVRGGATISLRQTVANIRITVGRWHDHTLALRLVEKVHEGGLLHERGSVVVYHYYHLPSAKRGRVPGWHLSAPVGSFVLVVMPAVPSLPDLPRLQGERPRYELAEKLYRDPALLTHPTAMLLLSGPDDPSLRDLRTLLAEEQGKADPEERRARYTRWLSSGSSLQRNFAAEALKWDPRR